MDTYLGICPGHCTGDLAKIQTYLDRLEQAKEFLSGKHDVILADLRTKMQEAAAKRAYEKAGEYKSMMQQIEATGNAQIVRDVIDGDAYVIVALEKYDKTFMGVVEIQRGMIVGVREFTLENPLNEESLHLVSEAAAQFFVEKIATKAIRIFTDLDLEKTESWSDFSRE